MLFSAEHIFPAIKIGVFYFYPGEGIALDVRNKLNDNAVLQDYVWLLVDGNHYRALAFPTGTNFRLRAALDNSLPDCSLSTYFLDKAVPGRCH